MRGRESSSKGGSLLVLLPQTVLLMAATMIAGVRTSENVAPRSWWRFEDSGDPYRDELGMWPIGGTRPPANPQNTTQWREQADGGVVGGYLDFGFKDPAKLLTPSRDWWEGNAGCTPFPCNDTSKAISGFSIEFLLKPGPWLYRGGSINIFGELSYSEMPVVSLGSASISFIAATRPAGSDVPPARPTSVEPWDEFSVSLTGDGVTSSDYLADGHWHHFAFVKSAATGEASIWIDGQRPSVFHRPANSSLFGRKFQNEGALSIDRVGQSWNCSLDEMAIYESALPDAVIYAHYADAMIRHRPYTMGSAKFPPPPAPAPVRPADRTSPTADDFDLQEFAPGTVLPTPKGNATQGVHVSAIHQLRRFPRPRFDATAVKEHGMMRLYNWMDPAYLAGQGQPNVSVAQLAPNSVAIQTELATSWNYGVMINPSGSRDVGGLVSAMVDAHPEWTLDQTIIRQQTAGKSQISNRTLPKGCYLQNEHGQLITETGAVLPDGGVPLLRVTTKELANEVGCPDSLFALDAKKAIAKLMPIFENCSSCDVSRLNEDGEYLSELSKGNLSVDPQVLAAFEHSGAATWQDFHGSWRVRLTAEYRDAIFQGVPAMRQRAKYSEYQVQGTNPYFGNWSRTRLINTIGRDGMRYSTADFYVPEPRLWFSGAGPWHGINWLEEVRRSEIATGDTLFSPFVAAGWHIAEEENVRPAQWLGLLKLLGIWGAEFFYTGFFSLSKPFPIPANWVWQAVIPSYAQAVTSQYADLFFDSDVLEGDLYSAYTLLQAKGGYSLWAGAGNRIAMARKHRSKDVYVVSVTVQRYSNIRNSSVLSANVSVRLPNTNINLEVEARRQGSTYVLDNTLTRAASPRLVQLDGFHEPTHPYFWSLHVDVEAEMFQGFLHDGELHPTIVTESSRGRGGVNAYSFLDFTSFVRMSCGQAEPRRFFNYTLEAPPAPDDHPANADGTRDAFVWVRARAGTTGNRSAALHAVVHAQHPDSTSTVSLSGELELLGIREWTWCRFAVETPSEGAGFATDGSAAIVVELGCPVGEVAVLEVDRLVLTFDANHDPGRV